MQVYCRREPGGILPSAQPVLRWSRNSRKVLAGSTSPPQKNVFLWLSQGFNRQVRDRIMSFRNLHWSFLASCKLLCTRGCEDFNSTLDSWGVWVKNLQGVRYPKRQRIPLQPTTRRQHSHVHWLTHSSQLASWHNCSGFTFFSHQSVIQRTLKYALKKIPK